MKRRPVTSAAGPLLAVLAGLCVAGTGCSASGPGVDVAADGTDGTDPRDASSETRDAGDGRDAGDAPDPATEAGESDAGGDSADVPVGPGLVYQGPRRVPLGQPFPLVARADAGTPTTTVVLGTIDGPADLRLHRGRGSVSLTATQAGPLALLAPWVGLDAADLAAEERPARPLSGTLAGDDLAWAADRDVVLEGTVEVPAGATLGIGPGTRVLAGAKANLVVRGTLEVRGTAEAPVLFTRSAAGPWGGIRVLAGATATIEHAWLTAGGGDAALAMGHSASQPVVYAEDAVLTLRGGGLVDNPGKALGSRRSVVTVQDALISRCDTGGEHEQSKVRVAGTHVLEMPNAAGVVGGDEEDNDGLYLWESLTVDGQVQVSEVVDCVFAVGADDGIDHNGATVRVERTWIEGFFHEGVAASNTGRVDVVDSVVRDCEQGIEAGYGSPEVVVDHCLVTGNDVGLRYGDGYDRDVTGTLSVRNTVAVGNGQNVRNFVIKLDGPRDGAVSIGCSRVDSPEWDGRDGNRPGNPAWDGNGCPAAGETASEGPGCDGSIPGPRCP